MAGGNISKLILVNHIVTTKWGSGRGKRFNSIGSSLFCTEASKADFISELSVNIYSKINWENCSQVVK